jgi:hypothetical protein
MVPAASEISLPMFAMIPWALVVSSSCRPGAIGGGPGATVGIAVVSELSAATSAL